MDWNQLLSDGLHVWLSPEKMARLIRLVLLLVVGIPVIIVSSRMAERLTLKRFSEHMAMLMGKLVFWGLLTVIAFSVLRELGFQLTHLLGAAGVVGVAVGFAAQTSFSNVISGIFLMGEKPFEVGDVIQINTNMGAVMSVDFLSVKLRTFDNKFVRIPNEILIKSEFTNLTRFPIRRVDLRISVAYREKLEVVRALLLEVAQANPLCLSEPEPLVVIDGFGVGSVELQLLLWVRQPDYLELKNSVLAEVKARFDAEGIEIPYYRISPLTEQMHLRV